MVRRSSFSRNSRSNSGAAGMGDLSLGYGIPRADSLQNRLENGLRRLPVRMRVEVENDAVAQHTRRYVQNIFHRQMKASAHERMHAAALHQRLRAARRSAEAHVLARHFVSLF